MVGGLEIQKKTQSSTQRPSSTSSQHSGRERSSRPEALHAKPSQQNQVSSDGRRLLGTHCSRKFKSAQRDSNLTILQDSDATETRGDDVFLDMNGNNDDLGSLVTPEAPAKPNNSRPMTLDRSSCAEDPVRVEKDRERVRIPFFVLGKVRSNNQLGNLF